LFFVGNLFDDYYELIATDPSNGIHSSDIFGETFRNGSQQLIPKSMPKAVINPLEVIKIGKKYRDGAIASAGTGHRLQ
jgi:hypothetical protein